MSRGYDTLVWAEADAKNGILPVAALAGQAPYLNSGDTLKMIREKFIVGLGGSSLTKPNGCALSGDKSRAGQKFHANAMISQGFEQFLHDFALDFEAQELITAHISTTNVAEEQQVVAVVADVDNAHAWPKNIIEAGRMAGIAKIHCPIASITVATTKTMFNGEVDLAAAIEAGLAGQKAGWLSSSKEYAILGLMNTLATTAKGTIHFRGLTGDFEKRNPGIPLYGPLLATFDNPIPSFMPSYDPIPFMGNALPQISEVGLVAAAHTFGIVIGEK